MTIPITNKQASLVIQPIMVKGSLSSLSANRNGQVIRPIALSPAPAILRLWPRIMYLVPGVELFSYPTGSMHSGAEFFGEFTREETVWEVISSFGEGIRSGVNTSGSSVIGSSHKASVSSVRITGIRS